MEKIPRKCKFYTKCAVQDKSRAVTDLKISQKNCKIQSYCFQLLLGSLNWVRKNGNFYHNFELIFISATWLQLEAVKMNSTNFLENFETNHTFRSVNSKTGSF